jgi:hypothetical protein
MIRQGALLLGGAVIAIILLQSAGPILHDLETINCPAPCVLVNGYCEQDYDMICRIYNEFGGPADAEGRHLEWCVKDYDVHGFRKLTPEGRRIVDAFCPEPGT